jgi:glycosyltransferase involved in cell wall biosynthesis
MTDPLGQSQVLPYLIGLSKFQLEIHLVSFEKKDKFNFKKNDIEKLITSTSIVWHPLIYHQRPPVFSTLFDIWQMNKKTKEIIHKNNISIIHCRSYISSLIGLHIKRKFNIPFVFDVRGFWADERIDGNIWNLNNPVFKMIYRFFKSKEKQFMMESNHIISLTDNAKNEILSWNLSGIDKNKIQVIPCCADLEHFSRNKIDESRLKKWRTDLAFSESDFIMSYVGSLGTWYMIDEMMEFFNVARKKIENCKFLIITGDNPEIAINAAKKFNIDLNNLVIRKAERNEVPYFIALSQFSMFFIKPSYSKKASSPTKLAEILGMGIPVICNNNVGDVEPIVNNGQVGFVVQDFNQQSYEIALDAMLQFLPANAETIASYAVQYASLQDGILKYKAVYDQLLSAN